MDWLTSFFGTELYHDGAITAAVILFFATLIAFYSWAYDHNNEDYHQGAPKSAKIFLATLTSLFVVPWVWFIAGPLLFVGVILWGVSFAVKDALGKGVGSSTCSGS